MWLKRVVDSYMQRVPGLREYCEKCLGTERWEGSAVLMNVDTSFTSIGLNYFTAVVPRIEEFNKLFVKSGKIKNLRELGKARVSELKKVWKNERSWKIAKEIASYLSTISENDKVALRTWAKNAKLES